MSHPSSIRKSDRKASQILGVTITRDQVDEPMKPQSIVESLKSRFRLGRSGSDGPSSGAGPEHAPTLPYSDSQLVRLPPVTAAEISRLKTMGYGHGVEREEDNDGEYHDEDVDEAEEYIRKMKRNAQRSRAKALAILGKGAEDAM